MKDNKKQSLQNLNTFSLPEKEIGVELVEEYRSAIISTDKEEKRKNLLSLLKKGFILPEGYGSLEPFIRDPKPLKEEKVEVEKVLEYIGKIETGEIKTPVINDAQSPNLMNKLIVNILYPKQLSDAKRETDSVMDEFLFAKKNPLCKDKNNAEIIKEHIKNTHPALQALLSVTPEKIVRKDFPFIKHYGSALKTREGFFDLYREGLKLVKEAGEKISEALKKSEELLSKEVQKILAEYDMKALEHFVKQVKILPETKKIAITSGNKHEVVEELWTLGKPATRNEIGFQVEKLCNYISKAGDLGVKFCHTLNSLLSDKGTQYMFNPNEIKNQNGILTSAIKSKYDNSNDKKSPIEKLLKDIKLKLDKEYPSGLKEKIQTDKSSVCSKDESLSKAFILMQKTAKPYEELKQNKTLLELREQIKVKNKEVKINLEKSVNLKEHEKLKEKFQDQGNKRLLLKSTGNLKDFTDNKLLQNMVKEEKKKNSGELPKKVGGISPSEIIIQDDNLIHQIQENTNTNLQVISESESLNQIQENPTHEPIKKPQIPPKPKNLVSIAQKNKDTESRNSTLPQEISVNNTEGGNTNVGEVPIKKTIPFKTIIKMREQKRQENNPQPTNHNPGNLHNPNTPRTFVGQINQQRGNNTPPTYVEQLNQPNPTNPSHSEKEQQKKDNRVSGWNHDFN